MCKFSSKSGGVPFQISFFWGDLTRNHPIFKSIRFNNDCVITQHAPTCVENCFDH